MKHIIREVPAEYAEFDLYFDDDGLTSASGDFCNNLFIVCNDGWGRISGFNIEEYKNMQKEAEFIIDSFDNIGGWYGYSSCKEAMESCGIEYNPRKCHLLKEWQKSADECKPESIAEYLTITTGKEWSVKSARGYCQGDFAQILYCPERYKDGVEVYGDVFFGCAKEFVVIDLDENGEEADSVGGYIVADCQANADEDYKRIVCEWAEIDENETVLEMIDGQRTVTQYTYRTA